MGDKWFEDFEAGTEVEYGNYEVTKEAIIEFAEKFDPQHFHIDEEAAKKSNFGGLIASGWHTASMFMRMTYSENLGDGSGSLGSAGVEDMRWLKPVRPGDVLRVRARITNVRESNSKPDRGIVESSYIILNQHDEEVMSLKSMGFFLKRSPVV